MSSRQPLKGQKSKDYQILSDFIKGYDTKTSDDVLKDNVLRDLMNYSIDDMGAMSKRKGCKNLGITELFTKLLNNDPNYTLTHELYQNIMDSADTTLTFESFFNQLFKLENDTYEVAGGDTITIKYDKVLCTKPLDEYSEIDSIKIENKINKTYKYLIILGGYTQNKNDVISYFFKYIRLDYIYEEKDGKINVDLKGKIVKTNPTISKYEFGNMNKRLYDEGIIEPANYNDLLFFATGRTIYKVEKSNFKTFIDLTNNPYKPTPIEVANIGFNIVANDPLTYVDTTLGNSDSIKGIYYIYNNEPTQVVPFNKPFKIQILSTGATALGKPEYRPDNGEIDETLNPYKEFNGSFSSGNTSLFECTGFDQDGKFEIRIKKGSSIQPYRGHFQTGNITDQTVGKVQDIKNLIKTSLYCKIINTQLVLYGAHGYLFFSDFDRFDYYPNYYYLYAVETLGDEVKGIKYFRQYHAVFTSKQIKRMTGGFGTESFGIYPLNDFVGCLNGNTIKQIENNLVFLANDGLYMLKQGYIGEGTENVVRIDENIDGDYDVNKVVNAFNVGDRYTLALGNDKFDALNYSSSNSAFFKYKFANNGKRKYMPIFSNNAIGTTQILPYIDLENNLLQFLDFECSNDKVNIVYSDDNLAYNSYFTLIKVNFGTPTNNKKFKKLYIKSQNKSSNRIPLYVTIIIDDHVLLQPDKYRVYLDQDDNTIKYRLKTTSDIGLENGAILGDIILGRNTLGEKSTQTCRLDIGDKGKSIAIKVEDNYDKNRPNTDPFSVVIIGFVFKLKKVKEDVSWKDINNEEEEY